MRGMTLDQLRAVASAGAVEGVTLKGQDGGFLVEIDTSAGDVVVLSKARSTTPRLFGDVTSALKVLTGVGILAGRFDISDWNADDRPAGSTRRGRSEALQEAHRSAAYNRWVAAEIAAAMDDPVVPHEDVMRRMEGRLARLRAKGSGENPA